MHKICFFLCGALFSVELLHAAQEKSKIEVTAKELDTTKITVKATGGVLVYYQDSLIKASSALYNKETKLLTLDGNVEMIGPEGTKEHAKHLEIITDKKDVTFEELFFINENDVKNVVIHDINEDYDFMKYCLFENTLKDLF